MKYLSLLIVAVLYSNTHSQQIEVRPPALEELPSVLELDKKVTEEFFQPLYEAVYQHLGIERDVKEDLQKELTMDAESFAQLVTPKGSERLHIAWDTENNIPCGLIAFSQHENNDVSLDLLLVDKKYRQKGIGKKLVHSIFQIFTDTRALIVCPFQFNNESTLKFYESLGFKNLGLAPVDKTNCHGIRYSDLYYYYRLDVGS